MRGAKGPETGRRLSIRGPILGKGGGRESRCTLESSGCHLENGLWDGVKGDQGWAAAVVLGGGDQYGDGGRDME